MSLVSQSLRTKLAEGRAGPNEAYQKGSPSQGANAAALGTVPAALGDSFIKGVSTLRSLSLSCPPFSPSPQALLSRTGENRQMLTAGAVKY